MSLVDSINRINSLSEGGKLRGADFERLIHEGLLAELPFCVLANVALFRPDQFRTEDASLDGGLRVNSRAYELDNLFHYRRNEVDTMVIVEAKMPKITLDGDRWTYERSDRQTGKVFIRDARDQLISHAETILRYLRPVGRNVEMRVHAILVSGASNVPKAPPQTNGAITLELCSYHALPGLIQTMKSGSSRNEEPPQFQRIAQSEYMTLLRLGIPLNTLGHPELRHAIHYINRCKRDIDNELYRIFAPSKRRWAINGTAGMGKSVLLAYATSVFACDYKLVEKDRRTALTSHEARSKELGIKPLTQRNVCVFAMKPKQRNVLESLYATFVRDLSEEAPSGDLYFLKPRFDVWMDEKGVPKGCNVLVIDESHDLSEVGQELVREWHESSEEHYLLLACDRHQKIRLSDSKATIIKGLSFSSHSKFLRRNYRNPFPVYAAAIGLMFRWFAKDGVKVIPTAAEFKDLLGFEASATTMGNQITVKLKDDSHPANLWSHSVGAFRSCSTVYSHLMQQNLTSTEVLWVRFSKEDPDFNYELLHCFTYHNFCSAESAALVDKYVKGQEFPIVVIEGFPDYMDEGSQSPREASVMSKDEKKMWSFRRQVYICASRATAFLYFVCDVPETENVKRIKGELDNLISALSVCSEPTSSGSKEWRFSVMKTAISRKVAVFDDLQTQPESGSSTHLPDEALSVPAGTATILPKPAMEILPASSPLIMPAEKPLPEDIGDIQGQRIDAKQVIAHGDQQPDQPSIVQTDSTGAQPKLPKTKTTDPVRRPSSMPPLQMGLQMRTVITVKRPIVVSELATALGKSIPRVISDFNGLGVWPNAKSIVSEAEAKKLANLLHTDLEFSEST